LCFGPDFQNIRNELDLGVPVENFGLKRLLERRELHGLSIDNMFIEDLINIVVILNHESVLERNQLEIDVLPNGGHRVEHRFDLKLFSGFFTDFHAEIDMIHQFQVQTGLEREIRIRSDILTDFFRNLFPMTLFHALFAQSHH